jgi:hypothetical protein
VGATLKRYLCWQKPKPTRNSISTRCKSNQNRAVDLVLVGVIGIRNVCSVQTLIFPIRDINGLTFKCVEAVREKLDLPVCHK